MKNEKEFYDKVRDIAQELLAIEAIKKRVETVFFIFEKGNMAFAIGGQNTTELKEEIEPYVDQVTKILSELVKFYLECSDGTEVFLKIALTDYMKPKLNVEEVKEFLYKNELGFLIDRLEDTDFCMEILNAKFGDNPTDEVKDIFNYFN